MNINTNQIFNKIVETDLSFNKALLNNQQYIADKSLDLIVTSIIKQLDLIVKHLSLKGYWKMIRIYAYRKSPFFP